MKFKIAFLLPLLLLTGAQCTGWLPILNVGVAPRASEADEEIAFSPIQLEANSSYAGTQPRFVLIQTQTSWETFWAEQVAGNKLPAPPAPEIDFQTHLILAVFTGQKNTSGYSLRITNIKLTTISGLAEVIVEATETHPPADARLAQVITSPVQLVSVEKDGIFDLEDVYMLLTNSETGAEQPIPVERL